MIKDYLSIPLLNACSAFGLFLIAAGLICRTIITAANLTIGNFYLQSPGDISFSIFCIILMLLLATGCTVGAIALIKNLNKPIMGADDND